MSLVDTDLRSVQEARILLEHAEESREVLEGLPGTLVDGFLERALASACCLVCSACRRRERLRQR